MTGYGMHPDFFTTPVKAQFNASASQPITSQPDPSATQPTGTKQDASATQPNAQGTWSSQMTAQANASAPPPMTPQQPLAILLQHQSPSEVLISQSPHQKGVNWVFHDQASGQLQYVNVSYKDSTGQQSPSPSIQQQATQHTLNRVTQQAHQMPLAEQPMTHMSPQPAMMMNSPNMVFPQQMLAVDQQVDWNTKIAEVIREQFGLRPK